MINLLVGIFLGVWLDQTFELPNIQTHIKALSEQYKKTYLDKKE